MWHQDEIRLSTRGGGQMHDLTDEVARIVRDAGVTTGLVHVFNVGSTGAIGTIEYEPGLERDLPMILNEFTGHGSVVVIGQRKTVEPIEKPFEVAPGHSKRNEMETGGLSIPLRAPLEQRQLG